MDKRRKTHSANAASRNPTTSGARATLKSRAASSSSSISIGRPDSRTGAKSRQTFSGAPRGLGMSDPPKPQRATQKLRTSSKIATVVRTKSGASFIREHMTKSGKRRGKRFIFNADILVLIPPRYDLEYSNLEQIPCHGQFLICINLDFRINIV